jgi:hypothetical protein
MYETRDGSRFVIAVPKDHSPEIFNAALVGKWIAARPGDCMISWESAHCDGGYDDYLGYSCHPFANAPAYRRGRRRGPLRLYDLPAACLSLMSPWWW